VLDDVERRAFLVHPARKDPPELPLGIGNVDLDEGAGQLLILPRRRRLAGAQPDDDVADPHRLAGPHGKVARDAVPLVEELHHRDALGHGRRAGRDFGHRLRDVDDLGFGLGVLFLSLLALGRAGRPAGGENGGQGRRGCDRRPAHHAQSGVQAS
jgi:hypothetical protein